LGSCVAICLHDRAAKVGGLAHVLLPEAALARDHGNLFKFASTAVPLMVKEMEERGARGGGMGARLVGRASMFTSLMAPRALTMGARTLRGTREALRRVWTPILGEAVGGDYGRSVRFTVAEGKTVVSSVG